MNDFVILKGKINRLETFDHEVDFVRGKQQWLSSVPAVGQAILGNAAAAASSLIYTDSTALSVQNFCCYVGKLPVTGCFSKAFFKDGDDVEVVAVQQEDGTYFAYSIRRPIDHRIWLYPWATRGSQAVMKTLFKVFAWAFLFFSVSGVILLSIYQVICWLTDSIIIHRTFGDIITLSLSVGLVAGIGFSIFFLRIESKNCKLADQIFMALGYKNPKSVNMEKEEFKFLTKNPNDPDFYCDIHTPQYKQIYTALWVHHYREAPTLPDWVTIIESKAEE